jgi:hypothetical protein
MLNITIFFNCHGNYIYFYLQQFTNCNINWIYIANFEGGGGKRTFLNNNEKNILQNTDILIIQYIKNNTKFLNHEKIIKITNCDAKIIKIPHYTFHGYNSYHLSDLICKSCKNQHLDELYNHINTEYDKLVSNYDWISHIKNNLIKIEENDKFSDIKMLKIFKQNCENNILFNEPWHPNSYFIYLLVIEILKFLNFEHNFEYIKINELFSETQFNLQKKYMSFHENINHYTDKEILNNIKNKNINIYNDKCFNTIRNILYNEINIDNLNEKDNLKIVIKNNDFYEIEIDHKIYYINNNITINIPNIYYVYFHSKLLNYFDEINDENIKTYIEHPACQLLNKNNLNKLNNFIKNNC